MTQEHRLALPIGHRIEEYRIEAILGSGGFGVVYEAHDVHLDKRVAVKEYIPNEIAIREGQTTVFAKSSADEDDFFWGLERFLDEARTLAKFSHPSIVRVQRFFEANNTAYMVMDFEAGPSLADVIDDEGLLDETRALQILGPLLEGLDVVHAAGYLHRDIKPANILIRADGSPVLIDFGATRNAIGARSRSVTAIASAGYTPFEQYQTHGNQGPWTDIYAVGATFYRAVTGKKPVPATDRIGKDAMASVSELAGDRVSQGFAASIMHALEVDEAARPQSISEWRTELFGGERAPARKPMIDDVPTRGKSSGNERAVATRSPSNRVVMLVAAIFVVGAVTVAAWFAFKPRDDGMVSTQHVLNKAQSSTESQAQVRPLPSVSDERYAPGKEFRDCGHCPLMVVVPAGKFRIGSPSSELYRKDHESPQQSIHIDHPFAMSKYETSFAEWEACIQLGGCNSVQPPDEGFGRGKRPVINVNWHEAQSYAEFLGTATGKAYRLPSEAEWEYAARAGTTTPYSFGEELPENHANCEDCGSQWDKKTTSPVGSFGANAFGLSDMHGNVMEWVEDCYVPRYDGISANGQARIDADCQQRVLRDGHWKARKTNLRSAHRFPLKPFYKSKYIGFRVVRTLD
ncbi:MAG: SUMF1/EgtB/PvdO family nonheme iron enzyme [Gammaproteobacteria bacterium]|nr:SUMF1/EgtB/PvdO family nonheme iron enzyme [Gammaproteobacteria bacterium]MCP5136472.1 SUMF1/EgtB/PvdO family nonheme iron enzyme [Gammaproteobacteria bacterium]